MTALNLALVLALVSLVAWAVLVFAMAVTAGPIHLLLAIGVTLLVYWWALRDAGARAEHASAAQISQLDMTIPFRGGDSGQAASVIRRSVQCTRKPSRISWA